MSKLDDILVQLAETCGVTLYTLERADTVQQIKDLIAEICEECDASPRYKQILEKL